ncbi:hypothetical protein CDL15_Pgr025342 [Punica granatum]|nr:hypothetical protein CDL15_Pgr025342 [Punica granatum]
MIGQPSFGDQRVNSRYLTSVWRVRYDLRDGEIERWRVEKAVRELMVGREGDERRQGMVELKCRVESSIRGGGSTYRSLEKLVEFIRST